VRSRKDEVLRRQASSQQEKLVIKLMNQWATGVSPVKELLGGRQSVAHSPNDPGSRATRCNESTSVPDPAHKRGAFIDDDDTPQFAQYFNTRRSR